MEQQKFSCSAWMRGNKLEFNPGKLWVLMVVLFYPGHGVSSVFDEIVFLLQTHICTLGALLDPVALLSAHLASRVQTALH